MSGRWFRLDDYYEEAGDACVFYPSLYARGYRFSAEDRSKMDAVLGPFLDGRLRIEFIAVTCLVTFALTTAAAGFLMTASSERLDAVLAVPTWVWLAGAVALSVLMLAPVVLRLRARIRRQLDEMGVEATEPPRPDFFVVDGALSPRRLCGALLALGAVLALAATIAVDA